MPISARRIREKKLSAWFVQAPSCEYASSVGNESGFPYQGRFRVPREEKDVVSVRGCDCRCPVEICDVGRRKKVRRTTDCAKEDMPVVLHLVKWLVFFSGQMRLRGGRLFFFGGERDVAGPYHDAMLGGVPIGPSLA